MTNPLLFLHHAATMMAGTALGQIIALLVSPILTRLYQPDDFGAFSAVVAAATIFSIFATLRYELAIVLPKEERAAANLAAAALAWSIAFCAGLACVIVFWPRATQTLAGRAADLGPAIPVLTLIVAWTQILSFIANRDREYRVIATSAVVQQAGSAAAAIGLGAVAFAWNGLVLGRITGQLLAGGYGAAKLWTLLRRWCGLIDRHHLLADAGTYRQFPLFNVPYSLMGTVSREFTVLALTAFHQLSAAGLYGLARAVLTAPISFLSSSFSQVFYKEAAVSIGTPEFIRLTLTLLHSIAAMASPFFVLGWLWSPEVFELVFGAQWREAGVYAASLIPIAFLSLFTSWPERVFEVRQKQYLSFAIQAVFDAVSIAAVWIALWRGAEPLTAVRLYVGLQCGYHLVYLFAVFRLSNMGNADYGHFLTRVASILVVSWCLQAPMTWIGLPQWVAFGLCVALAGVLGLAAFMLARREAAAA